MPVEIWYTLTAIFIAVFLVAVACFRRVVAPNEVVIVQQRRMTRSYGKDTEHGNVYYEWPHWVPVLGITSTFLPVSVFDIRLNGYEAYDKDRLPFEVDIIAFFRIQDTNLAAQRVMDFPDLEKQLTAIVQGAIRTVLASEDIDSIMTERAKFGNKFTIEVTEQLQSWGVVPVKNIELMDIRDAAGCMAVHNIMAKKKSHIEMDSRTVVAGNMRNAQIAEITAQRDMDLEKQDAIKNVGLRQAVRIQDVGTADQTAQQAILEQTALTKEKEMAVIRIQDVRQAEIDKNVNLVKADQQKQAAVLIAEGNLTSQELAAKAITAQGLAKAEAEKALLMAPVFAQTELAKEIGKNLEYQNYLITLRRVEAVQAVGTKQAEALIAAQIKVIANAGDPVNGVEKVMDLFSAKGGTHIGAMLEALAQTDQGKKILDTIKPNPDA